MPAADAHDDRDDRGELPAGSFAAWLDELDAALRGTGDAAVPCGSCSACCTSSQFVHIAPDELDALAHIPAELCFPAPLLPAGHVLLGYDERGHCPMLVDGRCSIYEHRPRTCRTYDCRVFAASGLDPARDGKADIARRAARWRFDVSDPEDARRAAAVRAAAAYLDAHPDVFPDGVPPPTATQLAVLAVEARRPFVGWTDGTGDAAGDAALADEVRVELRRILHGGP